MKALSKRLIGSSLIALRIRTREQKYYGDGFITGYGRIENRLVFVFLRTSQFLRITFRDQRSKNRQDNGHGRPRSARR